MRKLLLAGAIALLPAQPVVAYRLGVFADSTATSCSLRIDLLEFPSAWVVALLDGDEIPVIGGDFSVRGFPEDWIVSVRPYPPQDGVDMGGGRETPRYAFGFFEPHHALGGILPISKVSIGALSQVGPTRIWIDRGEAYNPSPPYVPSYEGPVLILEDPSVECQGGTPHYVPVVVEGMSSMINGDCSIAVERTTWQRVKALYRE